MAVDIASGKVHLEYEDVAVPGRVALVWDRYYSSALAAVPSPVGRGWTGRYFARLKKTAGEFEFINTRGAVEVFPDLDDEVDAGRVVRLPGAFLELFRSGDAYVVRQWDVRNGDLTCYCFRADIRAHWVPLRSIEDGAGNGLDLSWDPDGRLAGVRQRTEQRILVPTYTDGLITSVTLHTAGGEEHPIARYAYDDGSRLSAAFDAAGFADRFEYDGDGRLVREVVKDGGVFSYRYDRKGRCIRTSGLDRYQEKRLRFLDAAGLTEVTDSYDRTFRYYHVATGQIVRAIDPAGGQTASEYDEHGRLLAKVSPNGGRTQYEYDESGNRIAVTNAAGGTYRFDFDSQRRPVAMVDPAGRRWRRAYDEQARLVRTVDPLGQETHLTYDADGNLSSVRDPLGNRRSYQYQAGVLAAVTDWRGNVTRLQADAFGRTVMRRGPRGESTQFVYDLTGNLVRVVLADGTEIRATYDLGRNMTSVTTGNGRTTRFQYAACRRLLQRIDPSGGVVRFVWGTEPGRLERVVNEHGDRYEFTRDEAGRIVHERSFSGAERRFQYDAAGFPVAYTNGNGETIRITRDALHRIVGYDLPDGARIAYTYDDGGRIVAAASSDATVTFDRDDVGRIVRESQGGDWVASSYDAAGRVVATTTSLGHHVRQSVDANGHLTGVDTGTGRALEIQRNEYGREVFRQTGTGIAVEQQHDVLGRLVEQRVGFNGSPSRAGSGSHIPPESIITARRYAYNPDGTPQSITDRIRGRCEYTYDASERLLHAIGARLSESFSYDAAGNIVGMSDEATRAQDRLVYGPGGRLLQKGNTCYEYDAEGRRTAAVERADAGEVRRWMYEWDALNRLTSVSRPDGQTWRYRYDAFDRRVDKRGPATHTRYVWDQDVLVHQVETGGAASTWVFEPRSFVPLLMMQAGRSYTVVPDHLGTPRELVDDRGRVAWSGTSTVWGAVPRAEEPRSDGVDCPFRFPGQFRDRETGLHYNRFRYYDPSVGAYLSEDPIGLFGGVALYRYVGTPTRLTDPFGLCEETDLPPNTLTKEEAAELQALADKFNTNIDVIGSRAEGRGRNIDQPDLPVGKGPGTRSDIDVRIDGQVDIDTRGGLSDAVAGVGNGAGSVASSTGLPSSPPAILFRPGQPPVVKQ